MIGVLVVLTIAAALEVGGDAAIRHGLGRSGWPSIVAGAALLVAYGLLVNLYRAIDFGRLLGIYICCFFVISQLTGVVLFAEGPPSRSMLIGGALIVAGGVVIHLGAG